MALTAPKLIDLKVKTDNFIKSVGPYALEFYPEQDWTLSQLHDYLIAKFVWGTGAAFLTEDLILVFMELICEFDLYFMQKHLGYCDEDLFRISLITKLNDTFLACNRIGISPGSDKRRIPWKIRYEQRAIRLIMEKYGFKEEGSWKDLVEPPQELYI